MRHFCRIQYLSTGTWLAMLDIPLDELLEFHSDESVVCMVTHAKPPKMEYEGEDMTLTEATAIVLERESTRGIQGPLYWRYGDETLVERRRRLKLD